MSTQTSGFAKAEAKALPKLGCIGRVLAVGEARATKSGAYEMIPIEIEGYGASRSIKVFFMFRPDWLTPGFDPESLQDFEGGSGLLWNYERNVSQKGSVSLLQGLAGGTEEGLDKVAEAIFALPVNETTGGPDSDAVADVLSRILVDEGQGNLVGYVLRQQQEKIGTDPETNKGIYQRTQFYEVANWFTPNEKGRERIRRSAARATKGSFFVQFTDEDVPY